MKVYTLELAQPSPNKKQVEGRYHKSLEKQLFFDNNSEYTYLDLTYKLSEDVGQNSPKIIAIKESENLNDAMRELSGSSDIADISSFRDGASRYYFDGMRGFIVVQNDSDSIENIKSTVLSDYVLMLAYSQKIDEFITKTIQGKNTPKSINKFNLKVYFDNPLKFDIHQGRQLWQQIAKCADLKEKHDEMLRKCKALQEQQATKKRWVLGTVISAVAAFFAMLSSLGVKSEIMTIYQKIADFLKFLF